MYIIAAPLGKQACPFEQPCKPKSVHGFNCTLRDMILFGRSSATLVRNSLESLPLHAYHPSAFIMSVAAKGHRHLLCHKQRRYKGACQTSMSVGETLHHPVYFHCICYVQHACCQLFGRLFVGHCCQRSLLLVDCLLASVTYLK
eukprot:TRINITY_DN7297_c2_g1_i1.p1 TRINITY_DN7297_c2_g1~~TRINITY_DN7297_c2_g1_i1.p1  ORF type:complete len:144 (-),score=7.76 TRINITY_DN7297_c2_g1_i1:75-506(-)